MNLRPGLIPAHRLSQFSIVASNWASSDRLDVGQVLKFHFFFPLLSPENNGKLGERGNPYSS